MASETQYDKIEVLGARIHNLKNINVKIPKGKLICITGVSGSGKSSLAFDILFEEGRTRYFQAIGMPPRLESEKPFDVITGLSPTIAVEQRTVRSRNPRSTVGTRTGIYNLMRMLFTLEAKRLCPICKMPVNKDLACDICGMKVNRLEIKHFSFNEPSGMCLKCNGRGYIREFTIEKLIPDPSKTLFDICADATGSFADLRSWMPSLANHYGFDSATPYKDLPKKIQEVFLYGSRGKKIFVEFNSKQYSHQTEKIYEGVIPHLERAMDKSVSEFRQKKIEQNYMDRVICPECEGYRINEQCRQALISENHIGQVAMMPIENLLLFLHKINREKMNNEAGKALLDKIIKELTKFEHLGLSYLHLNRSVSTLSGGENQRVGLMTQLGLGLNGCVLILDEPTMGMHELEKGSLGLILRELQRQGNSVIIVEHDEKIIQLADWVIDIGPLSGVKGGEIVFEGTIPELMKNKISLTGQYLGNIIEYPSKPAEKRRKIQKEKSILLRDVKTNNLKQVNVKIPLNIMVGIAGVSGSGKSSLISDTLVPLIQAELKKRREQKSNTENEEEEIDDNGDHDPLEIMHGKIEGIEKISKCIVVDQSPIGRNRNSFPASYIGLWDYIRKLFAQQPLAKKRKYKEGNFSFNSDAGRCPACKGEGKIYYSISFLDEIGIKCEECEGTRYQKEILEIKYKDKNIHEILELSISDALEVFEEEPKILGYLKILDRIGMGYMTLGQPATTLSGGEAQRIKLAKALGDANQKDSIFILDEPTTGLHFHDEVKLLKLLDEIVNQGNSVVIVEHNTKILKYCDWIIELGPQGGPKGGNIIADGIPEQIQKNKQSIIAPFL